MAQKGDFIGFTFNGTHSSDLGIVRTSNGSRYNSNLLPSSQDQTVAVPGGDGVYFFGTNYQTRVFQLQIASDEISEETMRRIQQTWGDKEIHELIFDETPYKVYMAKCTNMPQFNFICFDENNQRVYKGEGSVEFTCFYPYAKSRYKFLDQYMKQVNLSTEPSDWPINYFTYDETTNKYTMIIPGTPFPELEQEVIYTCYKGLPEWYGGEFVLGDSIPNSLNLLGDEYIEYSGGLSSLVNKDEWAATSGLRQSQGSLDLSTSSTPAQVVYVYNPGDVEADFQLWFNPIDADGLQYYQDGSTGDYFRQMHFDFSDVDFSPRWEYGIYYQRTGEAGSYIFTPLTTIPDDWQENFTSYYYYEAGEYRPLTLATLIQYDSKTELLTGYMSLNVPNGKLYNKYITSGDFFKIPIMNRSNENINTHIQLITNNQNTKIHKIKYDYLYY